MIRPAHRADLPALMGMAERFHKSCLPDLPFEKRSAAVSIIAAIESDDCAVFVFDLGRGPVGVIAVHLSRFPFASALVAKEIILWVDPSSRGSAWRRLISAAEDWAKSRGAIAMGLSCFHGSGVEVLFSRAGYAQRESVSFKDL